MSDINNGGPAFPFEYHNQTSKTQPGFFGTGNLPSGASQQFAGMTLRDYFAAKALQAVLTSPVDYSADEGASAPMNSWDDFAQGAYQMADAMLKARNA